MNNHRRHAQIPVEELSLSKAIQDVFILASSSWSYALNKICNTLHVSSESLIPWKMLEKVTPITMISVNDNAHFLLARSFGEILNSFFHLIKLTGHRSSSVNHKQHLFRLDQTSKGIAIGFFEFRELDIHSIVLLPIILEGLPTALVEQINCEFVAKVSIFLFLIIPDPTIVPYLESTPPFFRAREQFDFNVIS